MIRIVLHHSNHHSYIDNHQLDQYSCHRDKVYFHIHLFLSHNLPQYSQCHRYNNTVRHLSIIIHVTLHVTCNVINVLTYTTHSSIITWIRITEVCLTCVTTVTRKTRAEESTWLILLIIKSQ